MAIFQWDFLTWAKIVIFNQYLALGLITGGVWIVINSFDHGVNLSHEASASIYNGRWSHRNTIHQWIFQCWQVRGGPSRHPWSALVSCQHHHHRRCWKHSAGRIEAQVARHDHWFQPAVRLSREKRCEGLQLPHSRSAPRAQSTDWRHRPDSRVQHRRFQAGLLQCTVEWRTGGDFR